MIQINYSWLPHIQHNGRLDALASIVYADIHGRQKDDEPVLYMYAEASKTLGCTYYQLRRAITRLRKAGLIQLHMIGQPTDDTGTKIKPCFTCNLH
jgi:hypothetical protein